MKEMNNINEFMFQKIKENNDTIESFCAALDISRATYFRYLKNPKTIKLPVVEKIARKLSLTHQECADYFGKVPAFIVERIEKSNEIIQNIFTTKSPFVGIESDTEFQYFSSPTENTNSTNNANNTINTYQQNILSTTEVVQRIFSSFPLEINEENGYWHHQFSITIYQAAERSLSEILAKLIYGLQKNLFDHHIPSRIKVRHYLPGHLNDPAKKNYEDDLLNKLSIWEQTMSLYSMCNEYEQIYDELSPGVWSGTDLCLIKYSRLFIPNGSTIKIETNKPSAHKRQESTYFAIKFSKDKTTGAVTAYISPLESAGLYRFFNIDTVRTTKHEDSIPDIYQSALEFLKIFAKNETIFIEKDFCYDCINPAILISLLNRIKENKNIMEYLGNIFGIEKLTQNSEINAVEKLISVINERVRIRSSRNDIVILHELGVREFAESGILSNLILSNPSDEILNHLRFYPSEIKEILIQTRNCILQGPNVTSQKFYFIRKNAFLEYDSKVYISKHHGAFIRNDRNIFKNLLDNIKSNVELADCMTNYWHEQIAQRKTSDIYSQDSLLMSDEEAVQFLDSLIQKIG